MSIVHQPTHSYEYSLAEVTLNFAIQCQNEVLDEIVQKTDATKNRAAEALVRFGVNHTKWPARVVLATLAIHLTPFVVCGV